VKRLLVPSPAFLRDSKRLRKKDRQASERLRETLTVLAEDAFDPRLKTHKLSGELEDCWACTVSYDLRLVFEIGKFEEEDAVILLSVGTHDEVY
jgi:addiction module RelE/StbE family toxin